MLTNAIFRNVTFTNSMVLTIVAGVATDGNLVYSSRATSSNLVFENCRFDWTNKSPASTTFQILASNSTSITFRNTQFIALKSTPMAVMVIDGPNGTWTGQAPQLILENTQWQSITTSASAPLILAQNTNIQISDSLIDSFKGSKCVHSHS